MIDALLAKLEREAETEIARVLEEARARAAAIVAAADAQIADQRRALEREQQEAGSARVESAVAGARHEARRRVLAARAQLLDRVFAELDSALAQLSTGQTYERALTRDVQRALGFTGAGARLVLHCAPALARRLRRAIHENRRLRVSGDDSAVAGFRLETADHRLEVDGTLAGLVERERPRLALEALAALRQDLTP
jgi:vacuolar-type H+-ATPase subunit E/Vma4